MLGRRHVFAIALIAIAALVALVPIEVVPHFACPMKTLTGLPCLTCGGTRAMFALGRLDPMAALRFNPLVTVGAFAFAIYVARRYVRRPVELRWSRAAKIAAAAAAAANWAYLVIDGR